MDRTRNRSSRHVHDSLMNVKARFKNKKLKMQQQLEREGMRNEGTGPKGKRANSRGEKKLKLKLEKNLEIRKQLEATLIYFKIEIKQVLVRAEHHKNCHAKGRGMVDWVVRGTQGMVGGTQRRPDFCN